MEVLVHDGFYTTVAQVLPVLLLALVWDSRYLERLTGEDRRSRGTDPANGTFWTKPRVRTYIIAVAAVIGVELAAALLVLGGVLDDWTWLRMVLLVGMAFVLVTLVFRIVVDVFRATK